MRKYLFFLLMTAASMIAQESEGNLVEVTIVTRVMVAEDDAESFINHIHQESKQVSDDYAARKGVYSVETEVKNETLIRSYVK